MIENLLGLLNVLGGESPKEMQDISKQIKPTEKHKEMAAILNSEGKGHLILGHLAINHSYASVIRTAFGQNSSFNRLGTWFCD